MQLHVSNYIAPISNVFLITLQECKVLGEGLKIRGCFWKFQNEGSILHI